MVFIIFLVLLLVPIQQAYTQSPSTPNSPLAVAQQSTNNDQYDDQTQQTADPTIPKTINDIIISGNNQMTTGEIRNRIPYMVGELFSPDKTGLLIKNLYTTGSYAYGIGPFKNVRVYTEDISNDLINLHIIVEEKDVLSDVSLEGNEHLSMKELQKKIDMSELHAIDEHDLKKIALIIKKAYRDKSYHHVDITPSLIRTAPFESRALFEINENKKSLVRRVFFEGNHRFSDKTLRKIIFTREDWVLGFLDRAGTYQPDAVEADKHLLEDFYKSHGFLQANIVDAVISTHENSSDLDVTFIVQEGDLYRVSQLNAPGNETCPEELLLANIPIRPGQLFSKELIRESIEKIRAVWGEYGYIYADIEPSVQPNDEDKTVAITFYSELGQQVYLNRINIIGNQKTRDKVIRRQLTLKEGELLTTRKMEESKDMVELLGYFDPRDGVNWKINRVDKNYADLDLIVREVKTGQVSSEIGFGGSQTDITNPADSVRIKGIVNETNLLGLGMHLNTTFEIAKTFQNFVFNLTEPWMFDRPIHSGIDVFYRQSEYDDFKLLQDNVIHEKMRGGNYNIGFTSEKLRNTSFDFEAGTQVITYSSDNANNPPRVSTGTSLSEKAAVEYQRLLNDRFESGAFVWFAGYAHQDFRNHSVHPSAGYRWDLRSKVTIPNNGINTAFYKLELDASWYTPLIGDRDLVFMIHSFLGVVQEFKDRAIPYRELYHLGGTASIRGFEFSEIEPVFAGSEPLGGSKSFILNAELIFPLSGDFSMKGAFFYDGGSSWDTPNTSNISTEFISNDNFSYRHSVGFGIRMLQPTPMKVDWGFKLDRKKGESPTKIHFSMYHNF